MLAMARGQIRYSVWQWANPSDELWDNWLLLALRLGFQGPPPALLAANQRTQGQPCQAHPLKDRRAKWTSRCSGAPKTKQSWACVPVKHRCAAKGGMGLFFFPPRPCLKGFVPLPDGALWVRGTIASVISRMLQKFVVVPMCFVFLLFLLSSSFHHD